MMINAPENIPAAPNPKIALCPSRISTYVLPKDRVLVTYSDDQGH